MESSLKTPIGILRVLIVIAVLITTLLLVVIVGEPKPNWIFLSGSAMIVVIALVNFVDKRGDANWSRFVLFMFIAMFICFIGDLLMAEVFYIIPEESLINGILMFTLGHVFYLLALKDRSPLILRNEKPRLITRNLGIWVLCIVVVIILFVFTIYDPTDMVISAGIFGYGLLLISVVAFSLSKRFDEFPQLFSICLFLGFILFFISDYIIGYRLTHPGFLSDMEAVGVTYLLGQLSIHLSSFFGGNT
ncbi:MAG: lysoplasmalogenase family protein [Candidatus Thorarchaeota archaeon SMTZ1-45]|nr:MAG: hypothetical protein AM325_03160 [Candidatus Thorarchaeota archaeon SMTZ1-45]